MTMYVFESKFLPRIRKRRAELIVVLAVMMCGSSFAQQSTVLTNVTVIDGTGRARPAQPNRRD